MTAFDYAVLAIVGLSILLSVWRGAVRELLALASWAIAFLAAKTYGVPTSAYLPAALEHPSLRVLLGFVIVFVAVLVIMTMGVLLLSKLIHAVGLGALDRLLGGAFGLLRGVLIVLVLVLLGGLTAAPKDPAWHDAMLSAPLEAAVITVKPYLPDELSKHISYE
jgi:membrane protein required for colicin V production